MQYPNIFSLVCQVADLDSQQELLCQIPSVYNYVCIVDDVNQGL